MTSFVNIFLIWVFESIHAIGELYGVRRSLGGGPPLLNWRESRSRFDFEKLIADTEAKHGKVCVRHMISIAAEDTYPQWSDNDNYFDPKLDKLLEDIKSDQLIPKFWVASSSKLCKKKHVLDQRCFRCHSIEDMKKLVIRAMNQNDRLAADLEAVHKSYVTPQDKTENSRNGRRESLIKRKVQDSSLMELKRELIMSKEREVSLEAALVEKVQREAEVQRIVEESKQREAYLENELANMWVLVAKLKTSQGAISDMSNSVSELL